jgi:hypothetical protein
MPSAAAIAGLLDGGGDREVVDPGRLGIGCGRSTRCTTNIG